MGLDLAYFLPVPGCALDMCNVSYGLASVWKTGGGFIQLRPSLYGRWRDHWEAVPCLSLTPLSSSLSSSLFLDPCSSPSSPSLFSLLFPLLSFLFLLSFSSFSPLPPTSPHFHAFLPDLYSDPPSSFPSSSFPSSTFSSFSSSSLTMLVSEFTLWHCVNNSVWLDYS